MEAASRNRIKFFAPHILIVLTTFAIAILLHTPAAHAEEVRAPKIVPPELVQWMALVPELGNKSPAFSIVYWKRGDWSTLRWHVPGGRGGNAAAHAHVGLLGCYGFWHRADP